MDYARQAGADGDTVVQQIADGTYDDWTRRVTDQASKDGVTATPTVLVDGSQLTSDQLTADGVTAAVQTAAAG